MLREAPRWYGNPAMHGSPHPIIPSDLLLAAYRQGVFPMAEARDDPEVFWVEPRERAIIPLDGLHVSRSLAKVLRQDRYRVTCDAAFGRVMDECASPRAGRDGEEGGSWISHRIKASYVALHQAGNAHSFECWLGERLVGGLYGVRFDRVFAGESMFAREDDASKVALAWLVACMKRAGMLLLDCQFMTAHLASLGAVEIPQADYLARVGVSRGEPAMGLAAAHASFVSEASSLPVLEAGASSSPGKLIAQSLTQTS